MTSGENVTELLTKQKNLIPLNIDQFCPNTNNEWTEFYYNSL